MDIARSLELGAVAAGAAVLGSMLGLGGGIFMVPIFTLFFGVDQKLAIGASAIAVATNSVVGSSVHLRSRFTNLRLAMLLQVTTAFGAIVGALVGIAADPRLVNAVFGAILIAAAVSMLRQGQSAPPPASAGGDPLRLGASYHDPATDRMVRYVPEQVPAGLAVSLGSGVISGMLGIGGGVVMVPAMNVLMRVPLKAAAGTSSFMVGITAVATATVFYAQGKIDPAVAIPALLGILLGAQVGSQLTRRLRTRSLVVVFVLILFYLGGSLLLRAAGITVPGQE